MKDIITINRHILSQQREHPEAQGDLSQLLSTMALAIKMISRSVSKAGLLNVLGSTGRMNVQGEMVNKLDDYANNVIKDVFTHSGLLAGMASEEDADIIELPHHVKRGDYVLVFDPLDGSSNIDVNVTIGTIFAIFKKITPGTEPFEEDFLRCGREVIAAGYAVYGSSTMLVYTTGDKVHGFTLDPDYGEFLLSHPEIKIPDRLHCYSINERHIARWPESAKKFVQELKDGDDPRYAKTTSRYIGTLVGDFHRNLMYGGVFMYPQDSRNPLGKLRLLYECIPLAYISEAAGGYASTGLGSILDCTPGHIHERSPLCIGNRREVMRYEELTKQDLKLSGPQ